MASDHTGSTNPFDFDDGPGRSTGGGPAPRPGAGFPPPGGGRNVSYDPFGLDTPVGWSGPDRVGQPMSWTALVLAVFGGILVAAGVAQALRSIRLQADDPFDQMFWWATLALVGVLVGLIAFVVSVVAVVKAQPRIVAVIALLVSLVAGVAGAYVGFRIGAQQLAAEVIRLTGAEGPEAARRVTEYLRERGIDPAPLQPILERIFG